MLVHMFISMGKIVSFYSFKGGTGRSTTLANTAYELARRGESVGCMDFDLSAPGLHYIYDVGAHRRRNTKPIHHFLHPNETKSTDIDDYVINVDRCYRNEDLDGELLLMPGDVSHEAADVAADISEGRDHWDEIMSLIDKFESEYDLDYVFLDSRSGISNHAIPIFDKAHLLLTFTKWTFQHKQGTYELFEWILETAADFEDIVTVASNVPPSVSKDEIAEWVEHGLQWDIQNFKHIHELELLKEKECIVFNQNLQSDYEKGVINQYKSLADLIQEY